MPASKEKLLSRLVLEIRYDPETSSILLKDKVIGKWDDEANINYPEDLVWSRDISSLFIAGFEAGFNVAKEQP